MNKGKFLEEINKYKNKEKGQLTIEIKTNKDKYTIKNGQTKGFYTSEVLGDREYESLEFIADKTYRYITVLIREKIIEVNIY